MTNESKPGRRFPRPGRSRAAMAASDVFAKAVAASLVSVHDVTPGEVHVEPATTGNIVHRLVGGGQSVAFTTRRGAARAVPESMLHLLPGTDPLGVCHDFGRRLAALHQRAVADASVSPRPWMLSPRRVPPFVAHSERSRNRGAVLAVRAEPAIAVALAHVDQQWDATTWIHGDLGPGNVLVQMIPTPDEGPRGRVRLIGSERTGVGDPRWDLAAALDTLGILAARWQVADMAAFTAFGEGYWQVDGPTGASRARAQVRPDPAWRCARALVRAWQVATAADRGAALASTTTRDSTTPGPAWSIDGRVTDLLGVAQQSAGRWHFPRVHYTVETIT